MKQPEIIQKIFRTTFKNNSQLVKYSVNSFKTESILLPFFHLYIHPFALVLKPLGAIPAQFYRIQYCKGQVSFRRSWAGYRASCVPVSSAVRDTYTSPKSGRESFKPDVTARRSTSSPRWELLSRPQATHLSSPSLFISHTDVFPLCLHFSARNSNLTTGLSNVSSFPSSDAVGGSLGKGRKV